METKNNTSFVQELSDLAWAYQEMPSEELTKEFFAYNEDEKTSEEYKILLGEINLRSKNDSARWIYQNFQGPGKHCLDTYLFSEENKVSPKSKQPQLKVGILKKVYHPEIVKVPKKIGSKTMKVSIDYILENSPKRVHAIHGNLYERGKDLFGLIDYLIK